MKYKTKTFRFDSNLVLESGKQIERPEIRYCIAGNYVPGQSKVIWVCHALTANAEVYDWWEGLFGEAAYFDQAEYVVVCANVLGSCYGSSGPLTEHDGSAAAYGDFPLLTTRDLALAHDLLRRELNFDQIHLLIGASLGGQQAQEFAFLLGDRLERLILIATNAFHSPYGIAFNESQRLAIQADPTFGDRNPESGKSGLIAARSIALLSYRSYEAYHKTQAEQEQKTDDFRAASYQRHQGEKLQRRFNAYSYWILSKAMDAHHIGRGRGSAQLALANIRAKTLVIGIASDVLFPVCEQEFLAKHIPESEFHIIDSDFGHDGFLIETNKLELLIHDFLKNDFKSFKFTTFKSSSFLN